ncbi:MAG: hypothetical protein DHS20C16_06440 [Phycisphaerae bacterium]|nr:MAG: hypothetical protein DHS20C16_06440 [Phycisphaerae bacterium]
MQVNRERVWLVRILGISLIAGLMVHAGGCTPMAPTGGSDNGGSDNGSNDGGGDGGSNDGGGDNGGGDNGEGGGNDSAKEAIIKTQIIVGLGGKIDLGDDLLVYGVGNDEDENVVFQRFNQPPGVHFLVPSEIDKDTDGGTMIPGSDQLFGHRDFEVVGKKVALVRSNNSMSIYDTQTDAFVDIDPSEITLHRIPTNQDVPGNTISEGPYVATINDTEEVADGNAIKIIDTSGDQPVVMSFPNPLGELDEEVIEFSQVIVDAENRQVVAAGTSFQNDFYLWDLDDPSANAERFDAGPGTTFGLVGEMTQMRLDGGYLMYHDVSDFDPVVTLVNLADRTVMQLDPSLEESPVALAGGSFGYFLFDEEADLEDTSPSTLMLRSAIGNVATAPTATRASQLDLYDFRSTEVSLASNAGPVFSQEDCAEQKRVGYGESACITPDGSRWFIAGGGQPRAQDFVLMSTGGEFSDFEDPEGTTIPGSLMGADVVCTSDVVAFRGLRDTGDGTGCIPQQDWVISIIVLDRLDN